MQINEKCHFQRLRTFIFDLKVASKRFSKRLLMTSFRFKGFFWIHYLAFPENGFNFVTQKFERKWKMSCLNPRNIRFLPQVSFKTIFQNFSHDQLWSWEMKMVLKLPKDEKQTFCGFKYDIFHWFANAWVMKLKQFFRKLNMFH